MKKFALLLFALSAPLSAQYQYYINEPFTSINTNNWTVNGYRLEVVFVNGRSAGGHAFPPEPGPARRFLEFQKGAYGTDESTVLDELGAARGRGRDLVADPVF